ncbi:MAG TPA: choice-of-anchor Q domain-containing protein, partial [Gemmataceae bacterium]|nr:choice-of-anchor Q domain-containing protein [Gemmataceae bacterium]
MLEDRVTPAGQLSIDNLLDNGGINPAPFAGTGTLRQAIIDANALSGAQTIVTANGVFGIINLASSLPTLKANITITAPRGGLIISGGLRIQDFVVGAGAFCTFNKLQIWNGDVSVIGKNGGGIDNEGTLTLNDCEFLQNKALKGGAIFNNGSLTVSNSKIEVNTATFAGGGIYSTSLGTLTIGGHTTLMGNEAASPLFVGIGGGIFTQSETSIDSSDLNQNEAGSAGAGFYAFDANIQITNTVIWGSKYAAAGGAIFLTGGSTLRLSNSTIDENQATEGAGIYVGNGSSLNAINDTISSNGIGIGRTGGGVLVDGTSGAEFANTIIAYNQASDGPDVSGNVQSWFCNLVTDPTGSVGFDDGDILFQDPDLGELQDNGGNTLTRMPQPASPAIDA